MLIPLKKKYLTGGYQKKIASKGGDSQKRRNRKKHKVPVTHHTECFVNGLTGKRRYVTQRIV